MIELPDSIHARLNAKIRFRSVQPLNPKTSMMLMWRRPVIYEVAIQTAPDFLRAFTVPLQQFRDGGGVGRVRDCFAGGVARTELGKELYRLGF